MEPLSLRRNYLAARDALLAERTPAGHWVGELSTSALSTAVAAIALQLVDAEKHRAMIDGGLLWLAANQNADGGWGDTTKSFSNISTSMLVRAAFALVDDDSHRETVAKLEVYLNEKCGRTPAERAEAIRARYGKDRTFSVPILMTSALAGLVPWREVPRLPFELACLPQSCYRFAGLPVVSYALPALIAIGQCVHHHRGSWSPIRPFAKSPSLKVLRRIQPSSGGYLEATPLTAFVTMGLASIGKSDHDVVKESVRFLVKSVRPDGSWPIDTNLSIWVTTLSVNALAAAGDLESLPDREKLLEWLLAQQTKERHPYTGAAPGAWGWSDEPGSVPDCDDTPGAILALERLGTPLAAIESGRKWVLDVQNNDGGFPTFCRGWGKLPFDRSGADLTAHALRSLARRLRDLSEMPKNFWTLEVEDPWEFEAVEFALEYLTRQQRPDGSWLPLWFGNQHAPDDINPVYGTARVLAAYRDLDLKDSPECRRGVEYLLGVQNADGGWGGAKDCPSSVEETAVAVEVLLDLTDDSAVERGILWLMEAVESGRFREPSPIGFYFAKLWYFEKLYPIIFTVAALGRARKVATNKRG
ncbi:MAG: squalene--hopene cyclase [Gemmataceae bacterium]|nr:squalene--hopene cyclase [Gemmataceae bacterium]